MDAAPATRSVVAAPRPLNHCPASRSLLAAGRWRHAGHLMLIIFGEVSVVVPTSEVTIKNLSSGKVLKVSPVGEGTKVGQCSSKDSDDVTQRWRLIPVVGLRHQYQIQSVATGMVLEVAGESCEDNAGVFLWWDNGGAHQRWRLVPVGEGGHEYAIMNVHSGKALDLWDGAWRDDAEIVQIGYWHGMQQRWVLTACDVGPVSRAVMTIVRNESVFLPIWLRYYRQFFSADDVYILDHQSTDGSTEGHGFVRVPVSHPEYGAGWQRDVQQCYQHELVGRYDVVLCTDVDEIVAPDPRLGDLGTYIDRFDEDFVTCQGYEVLHQKTTSRRSIPPGTSWGNASRGIPTRYIPSLCWRGSRWCGTVGVINALMAG